MQWRVAVEVPLKRTEEERAILGLIERIVDPDEVAVEESGMEKLVIARARCLSRLNKLYELLRHERILDATRRRLLGGVRGTLITFMLHKQALAAGRVSLVDSEQESPLGPVIVRISHPEPLKVIDWLAPPTSQGRPVFQPGIPENECVTDQEPRQEQA